jgi:hypothetical protein
MTGALVTVLSCKEAVFKAFSPAPDSHGLSLTMHGGGSSGWAALDGIEPGLVAASWEVSGASMHRTCSVGWDRDFSGRDADSQV